MKNIYYILEVCESDDYKRDDGTYIDRGSCPLILNGTVFLFGGSNGEQQVSVIYPSGIKLINTLPFVFYDGRCHFNNGKVFLCFNDGYVCSSTPSEHHQCGDTKYMCRFR